MISRDGALTSLWQATTSRPKESLTGNRIAAADKFFDVVIVGEGITGVSTAILLQQAGFKCAILDTPYHTMRPLQVVCHRRDIKRQIPGRHDV